MSALRRVVPDAGNRRGWCPGLARPMPTGDGLLARIHPSLGILTRAQLRAVAEAARTFGNGHVDVTARANLQLRGITEATRAGLVAAMNAAGLGDARDDGGPQRLTLTSPLAGLCAEAIDVPALAHAIEEQGRGIAGLPPKTLVLIATGADLSGIEADLHVRAAGPGRADIGLAEDDGVSWIGDIRETAVAETVAALLRAFADTGRRRIRDLRGPERDALRRIAMQMRAAGTDAGTDSPLPLLQGRASCVAAGDRQAPYPDNALPSPDPCSLGGHPPPQRGEGNAPPVLTEAAPTRILTAEAPFGRCTAAMLGRLAEIAQDVETDAIRLSPTRGFVLAASVPAPGALADLSAAGFVTAPDDPRRAVAACPGAPACASGSTPTGADAARLAEAFRSFAARGMRAHVSGCAKGCAHPGRADLTLVARDGRYGVVLDGTAGDAPAPELTFEAALERVWRAQSGTLAQAFGPSPIGRRPRAEPAIGTTT